MSIIQWSSDIDIAKRHFAQLSIRAGILLGIGAITIPVTIKIVSSNISKYKNPILQAAQSDVAQKPPLDYFANLVLECVDEPDSKFGEAVLGKFGGQAGLRSAIFKVLLGYVQNDLVQHLLRLAGLYTLNWVVSGRSTTSSNSLLSFVSLANTPFPSYIALWDFGNTSHTVWTNRIIFWLPNVLLKYSLPLACCSNSDIGDVQLKAVSNQCTAKELAKWQLALNFPFVVLTTYRLVKHAINRASSGKIEPLPPSAIPAGKGKALQSFRSKSYLNAMLFEVGLNGANVGLVYCFAHFGPKVCGMKYVFDPARGVPYAWSSLSDAVISL